MFPFCAFHMLFPFLYFPVRMPFIADFNAGFMGILHMCAYIFSFLVFAINGILLNILFFFTTEYNYVVNGFRSFPLTKPKSIYESVKMNGIANHLLIVKLAKQRDLI